MFLVKLGAMLSIQKWPLHRCSWNLTIFTLKILQCGFQFGNDYRTRFSEFPLTFIKFGSPLAELQKPILVLDFEVTEMKIFKVWLKKMRMVSIDFCSCVGLWMPVFSDALHKVCGEDCWENSGEGGKRWLHFLFQPFACLVSIWEIQALGKQANIPEHSPLMNFGGQHSSLHPTEINEPSLKGHRGAGPKPWGGSCYGGREWIKVMIVPLEL